MKIDPFTVSVFENFAQINTIIWLNEGNVLETASSSHSLLARVTVDPVFPKTCGLYNASRFVNILKMYQEPEIEFKDTQLFVGIGSRQTRLGYGEPSLFDIVRLPKSFKFPTSDIKASISSVVLRDLDKAVRVLGVEDLIIKGDGKELTISAMDLEDETSNYHSIYLGQTDRTFKAVIKHSNMTLLPMDYDIEIVANKKEPTVKFTSNRIQYLAALDESSEF